MINPNEVPPSSLEASRKRHEAAFWRRKMNQHSCAIDVIHGSGSDRRFQNGTLNKVHVGIGILLVRFLDTFGQIKGNDLHSKVPREFHGEKTAAASGVKNYSAFKLCSS